MDGRGFLWIATQEGLNRYDGYSVKSYEHISSDPNTLSNDFVLSLLVDSGGQLWVGTASGVNRYDPIRDSFVRSPFAALGGDTLEPFLDVCRDRGCGIFILVKTSNPGGGLFQDLRADGRPVYQHVAAYVQRQAADSVGKCGFGFVGAVVGSVQLLELSGIGNPEVLQEHGGLWFQDESFVVSRRRG